MVVETMKPPLKVGARFIEDNGDLMTLKEGKTCDSHSISPETDPETLRMVGALGEMLFEQIRQTFRVDSLLVIAQNEDFRIVMFPRDGGIAVWKTNLEVDEVLHALHQSRVDQGKPVDEG